MEAKDLKIGDYVHRYDKTSQLRIERIVKVVKLSDKVTTIGEPNAICEYSDLEPIPLSEFWLITFGFYGEPEDFFLKDSILLKWGHTHTTEDGWLFHYGKSFAKHVKYVHELQNLFFALTGQELQHIE